MAMQISYIPSTEKPALVLLSGLGRDRLEALASALRSIDPQLMPEACASKLAETTDFSEADASQIVRFLYGLSATRDDAGLNAEEIADALVEAMATEPDLFATDSLPEVRDFLVRALADDSNLAVTFKSLHVLQDHERTFLRARILTDLRPVFGGASRDVKASVIVHNLKIAYRSAGREAEFFVALDHADLEALQEVLTRARGKEKSLEQLSQSLNDIPLLRVKT